MGRFGCLFVVALFTCLRAQNVWESIREYWDLNCLLTIFMLDFTLFCFVIFWVVQKTLFLQPLRGCICGCTSSFVLSGVRPYIAFCIMPYVAFCIMPYVARCVI